MDKKIRNFILTLFLLPIIPSVILCHKLHFKLAFLLLFICWANCFLCLISRSFATFLKNTIDKFLNFIGKYVAIITLFVGYICVVIPTGLVMKMTGRDRLDLKHTEKETYWHDYENVENDYERQF